ncbi:MAG: hypothetical protein RLZZ70_690 [Candidatus Parcubacteria bacterium]
MVAKQNSREAVEMDKIVLSATVIRDYAALLTEHFCQDSGICVEQVTDLCDYVVASKSVDLDVMRFFLESADNPILLRTQALISYPLPEYIPRLCIQFEMYRQAVLVGRFNHIDETLWTLGALFRSIKPFSRGNAIIGHLIENAARQYYKLPWRLVPLDRRHFEQYHRDVFCRHFGVTLG